MNPLIQNRGKIRSSAKSWHQIEVTGEHPTRLNDDRIVQQVIDEKALTEIVNRFKVLSESENSEKDLSEEKISSSASCETNSHVTCMLIDSLQLTPVHMGNNKRGRLFLFGRFCCCPMMLLVRGLIHFGL